MKFSELWLREWVNPAIDSDALANQITMAGLEVDGVEPVAGSFHGVVVGEVVECAQHPNADKLRVTKVNVGGDRLLDIVCGAPNCRQGLRVAVAFDFVAVFAGEQPQIAALGLPVLLQRFHQIGGQCGFTGAITPDHRNQPRNVVGLRRGCTINSLSL